MRSLFTKLYDNYGQTNVNIVQKNLDDVLNNVCITVYNENVNKENDIAGEWDTINGIEQEFLEHGYKIPRRLSTNVKPQDFINKLLKVKPSVVINNYEYMGIEDVTKINTCSIMDCFDIPYTGGDSFATAITTDKFVSKAIMSGAGIRTPLSIRCEIGHIPDVSKLNFPLFIKPVSEDGSNGIDEKSIVDNMGELKSKIMSIHNTIKCSALIEEYIDGNEYFVGVIGNGDNIEILPISETDFSLLPKDLRLRTKKFKDDKDPNIANKIIINCPANLSKELEKELKDFVLRAYSVFHLRDYARFDFRVDSNNRAYLLDINSNPDIADNNGFMKLVKAKKEDLWYVIRTIIFEAIKRSK
jgi:D-alanine-D-alanine ligase